VTALCAVLIGGNLLIWLWALIASDGKPVLLSIALI
jgi:hypothetical protein